MQRTYDLSLTTQGPLYPPSEVMDENGDFIVIGAINRKGDSGPVETTWGGAIVSKASPTPAFGSKAPYVICEEFDEEPPDHLKSRVLHTLPLPLPCANYPMLFAPEQFPDANAQRRPSFAFHQTPIPDLIPEHGRKMSNPVTLGDWMTAKGQLLVSVPEGADHAEFSFVFSGMLPNALYTVMSLRKHDLDPTGPTRPGPLGVPNVFVTDESGNGQYRASMPNPFPKPDAPKANRIINVVVLWMSYQLSHGGAIGVFGLGGDIHAQLKLRGPSFQEFQTQH